MSGAMVEYGSNGKGARGYLATPAGGSGPGVLVLQEWWGLVDHIKTVADRLAAEGYVALAPDLYHGRSTTNPDEAGKAMMGLDIERAGVDLKQSVDFLLAHDAVEPKAIGAIGFCMGGKLALFAGGLHPSIQAVVDFYGVHPDVKPDYGSMRCSVLCHFGKKDGFVSVDDANSVVDAMQAASVKVEAHFYDAGHAFFNDARPEAFDEPSASAAWTRTLEFLAGALRA